MIDINAPGALAHMAEQTRVGLEEATGRPHRYSWRIKPSQLGDDCMAAIFWDFRWASLNPIKGASARKMQRGTEAEPRLIKQMRDAGWEVIDSDPNAIAAGKKFTQYNFKAVGGHVSGYLDCFARHPVITGGVWIYLELKTMNKKDFNALQASKSMQKSNNKYYVQSILYMMQYNMPYGMFYVECTDNQEPYFEYIKRNDELANRMLHVANNIALAKSRPGRVAEQATYWKCQMCPHQGVCHLGEAPQRNCRSCVHLTAIDGGNFKCGVHGHVPNEKQILEACPQYEAIR